MAYYINKTIEGDFETVTNRAIDLLKEEGFGVLTQIDVHQVLKEKIDVDFRRYKILGACNPNYAYQALGLEDKIGTMLPCNVIIQEHGSNEIEVAAVDPVASMAAVGHSQLLEMAKEVRSKLSNVIMKL